MPTGCWRSLCSSLEATRKWLIPAKVDSGDSNTETQIQSTKAHVSSGLNNLPILIGTDLSGMFQEIASDPVG